VLENVDLEMKFFWEDLEKVNKTVFQSREAKKSKISGKVEVLKRDGVKIVLV
jgi:hypothetical protein